MEFLETVWKIFAAEAPESIRRQYGEVASWTYVIVIIMLPIALIYSVFLLLNKQ